MKECSFYEVKNSHNAKFWGEYNAPLDALAAEGSGREVRKQDKITKKVFRKLIDRAPELVEEIMQGEGMSKEVRHREHSKAETGV